jgi:hypothetical protein
MRRVRALEFRRHYGIKPAADSSVMQGEKTTFTISTVAV